MLDRRTYLVKERVAVLRLSDTYDMLDPATGATIGIARERISGAMKALRLIVDRRILPTTLASLLLVAGIAIYTVYKER